MIIIESFFCFFNVPHESMSIIDESLGCVPILLKSESNDRVSTNEVLMATKTEKWAFIFQAKPDPTPEIQRYRRLLKIALRGLKLRCLKVLNPDAVDLEALLRDDEVSSPTKNQGM